MFEELKRLTVESRDASGCTGLGSNNLLEAKPLRFLKQAFGSTFARLIVMKASRLTRMDITQ